MSFDEDQPEVRVRIDTTGVYTLSYDSLSAYAYPANVPSAPKNQSPLSRLKTESIRRAMIE